MLLYQTSVIHQILCITPYFENQNLAALITTLENLLASLGFLFLDQTTEQ